MNIFAIRRLSYFADPLPSVLTNISNKIIVESAGNLVSGLMFLPCFLAIVDGLILYLYKVGLLSFIDYYLKAEKTQCTDTSQLMRKILTAHTYLNSIFQTPLQKACCLLL